MLCFGVGVVELKPKHVRKSPVNENLLAVCGFAARFCYGFGIEVSQIIVERNEDLEITFG
jgi:hypothetical protein